MENIFMPAISVIVPFYNLEEYVPYCLNSILAQSFRDFELICINDGSTDGTRKLLEEYAQKDSRIKLIHQDNRGVSVARNQGMILAQGKYITFIDGDDAVTPEFLEILYQEAENSESDVTFCDFVRSEPKPNIIPQPCKQHPAIMVQGNIAHYQLLRKTKLRSYPWAKLYCRKFVEDERFVPDILYEDSIFFYNNLFRMKKVCHIQAPMYLYTQRPNSIVLSSFSIKKAQSLFFIYDNIAQYKDQLISPRDKELFHRKAIGYLRRILKGIYYLDQNDFEKILPQIQEHFQRLYANQEVRYNDFTLKYRFIMLMLVKRWDWCLLGLYKLDSKANGLVRKLIHNNRRY